MNPMTKALEDIHWKIPAEILREAFTTEEMLACRQLISLDTRIREQVLDKRVLVDMDIMGGTEVYIPLTPPVETEYVDPYTVIYRIPSETTQTRPIVQVYSMHFGILGYQNAGVALSYNQSAMSGEIKRVLDSALRTPPAATSFVNLIAPNTIMVRYVYLPYTSAFMRCRLGNDDSLSFIRTDYIPTFSDLCVAAVKAYIYNHMIVKIDQAFLSGGQSLGVFRDKVMEYAEAEQEYAQLLKTWKKVSTCFNDPEARRRHLRTIMPTI